MKTRFLLCAALALATAGALPAQFGLDKLKEAIKAGDKTGEATEGVGYLEDGSKVVKGVTGLSLAEEKEIGESVAIAVIGKYGGLVRDEATTQRVNLVGRALARYSRRPDLDWTFAVLASDSVNAFSAPGGYVFITRGLYQALTTDDALAGVLGHEIAHITHKDAVTILSRSEGLAGALSFVKKRSSDVRQADSVANRFNLNIEKIVTVLLEKGFDPKTEYAADKTGRELALTTGYAPGALRATLAMLQARGGAPRTMFSTHPPFAERIKRLPAESASANANSANATAPAPTNPAAPSAAAGSSSPPAKTDDDDEAFFNAADKKK